MNVTFDFDLFFDRPKVVRAIGRQKRRVLNRTGGFGRTTMKRSIRKAPKKKKYTATPPYPRWHTKGGLRLVFYSFNPSTESVDIGPLVRPRKPARSKNKTVKYATNAPVPRILNEGLTVKRITKFKNGTTRKRRIKYRTFDFASRALIPTAAKLNQLVAENGLL